MNESRNKAIRLICLSLTSLALVVTGVLYIISCIGIFLSGNMPFTRESVGEALIKLIIPSAITILFIITTSVLFVIFPYDKKKKSSIDSKDTRDILVGKISLAELSLSRGEAVVTERNKRFFLISGGILLFLLSLIYPVVYILTPDNFGVADINVDVLIAAANFIVSFIPLTTYSIIASFMSSASYRREAALLREGIKEKDTVSDKYTAENAKIRPISAVFSGISEAFSKKKKLLLLIVRCLVIALGITFIVLGILNGGMTAVLEKAVQICRECIGLG